ncbi:hypothetical protein K491DRAFT_723543 [Lophiostoma macrostomum CBS 122681]|uniref:protein-ribulosamine 3-kinase n=1 Tax=Lophiostoma macrostomum CBS 122681 TaxID=1314788 RepID=A0A6A6SHQ6_9PLEO|nr:hypothetical protein K491DRAFT_723543 [Lophiostoma macrostomum CBS 122681]
MSTNPADKYAETVRREREEKPVKIDRLDGNVIANLPRGAQVLSVVLWGISKWQVSGPPRCCAIDMKDQRASGESAQREMEGAFLSESAYHSYALSHVPTPVGYGEFKERPGTWFYLCEFRDMINVVLDVEKLVSLVVKVHKASMGKSPRGQYGFEVPTHLANLFVDNTWKDSWERWFTQAMRTMYDLEKQAQGQDDELDDLFLGLCDRVIPRLLRPLETGGRTIKPCLIHSDLWPGNCMPDTNTGELVVFDSCAFWGHNEAELGPWRAPRYHLGQLYLERYKEVMGISEPYDDWDDRNRLYALRYDFLLSALYPENSTFRARAKSEMRALVDKFPEGFQEESSTTIEK